MITLLKKTGKKKNLALIFAFSFLAGILLSNISSARAEEKKDSLTDSLLNLINSPKKTGDKGGKGEKEEENDTKAINPPPEKAPVKQGRVQVTIARILSSAGSNEVLVSSGVPFAKGQLTAVDDVVFFDKKGNEIPTAVKILGYWPQDNSIRSVLVQFKYKISERYEYADFQWGVKRQTKSLAIVEPAWDYPEAIILMSPQWMCDSQIIGEQLPMGQRINADYDDHIGQKVQEFLKEDKVGDLREEGYYSSPHVYYQFFVRSGELKYFLAARKELLNYRDNQTQLEGKDRGASFVATNVSRYTYIEALVDDYLLTGDSKTLEVAGYMAEFIKKNFTPKDAYLKKRESRFWTERHFAFSFLALLKYYELTGDKESLELSNQFMDNLYKTQMEWPERGGFIHNLYSHDPSEGARRDEYGGSPFMTGTLLEAIVEYHRLTSSPKAADSILRALDWIIKEGLVTSKDTVIYMTADKYRGDGVPDLNLLVVHAFGYGYRLTGYQNQKYYKIGQKLFDNGVKWGFINRPKQFNQNYRSSGHYLAYIVDGIRKQNVNADVSQGAQSNQKESTGVSEIKKPNIFIFESFENSGGVFKADSTSEISIDGAVVYLNGNTLRIEAKQFQSRLSASVSFDLWDLEKYPMVTFSYLIPSGAPVGLRVKTAFGDWLCLGGSKQYKCQGTESKNPIVLIDDGKWHEMEINAKDNIRSVLSGLSEVAGFEFATASNASVETKFWIDDFKIKK